ncbi:MAG: transposase family protein, partial [Gammaproteobacteria bacterium]|nr:transposase family protein [Gammaproteobacteria bacterium]
VIERPNQVWSTDITFVPMPHGFMYLVAIIDWFSRYVLAWQLSNTLDVGFCLVALEQALESGRPEIFNTDRAPVRAFIFSGGEPLSPAKTGTAQRLTQRSKDQWGQSAT